MSCLILFFWGHGPLEALYMPAQAEWFMEHQQSQFSGLASNNIYAFNEILRFVFEVGIVGFVLFICLCWTIVKNVCSGNHASCGSTILIVMSVFAGLFSYPFSVDMIVIVVIVAVAHISANTSKWLVWKGKIREEYKYIRFVVLCSFALVVLENYVQTKRADILLKGAQKDINVLFQENANYLYERFLSNPDFILCYGKTLYNNDLYHKALPVLEQGYRLRPSSELVCDLGMCYQYASNIVKAEDSFKLAVFMTPSYILPHYRLFCLYRKIGEEEKALRVAKYILTMPVKVVNTSVLRIRSQVRQYLNNIKIESR